LLLIIKLFGKTLLVQRNHYNRFTCVA